MLIFLEKYVFWGEGECSLREDSGGASGIYVLSVMVFIFLFSLYILFLRDKFHFHGFKVLLISLLPGNLKQEADRLVSSSHEPNMNALGVFPGTQCL